MVSSGANGIPVDNESSGSTGNREVELEERISEESARSLDAGAVIGVSLTFGSAAASNLGRTMMNEFGTKTLALKSFSEILFFC